MCLRHLAFSAQCIFHRDVCRLCPTLRNLLTEIALLRLLLMFGNSLNCWYYFSHHSLGTYVSCFLPSISWCLGLANPPSTSQLWLQTIACLLKAVPDLSVSPANNKLEYKAGTRYSQNREGSRSNSWYTMPRLTWFCFTGPLRSIVRTVAGDELKQQIGSARQCTPFRITRGYSKVGNVSFSSTGECFHWAHTPFSWWELPRYRNCEQYLIVRGYKSKLSIK